MAASDHLSTGLFHGSSVPLKPGDIVKPATQSGHTPYQEIYDDTAGGGFDPTHSRGDHVFMTQDETAAWQWSKTGSEDPGDWDHISGHPVPFMDRSKRVYEVEPIGGHSSPENAGVPGGTMIPGERVTSRNLGARVIRENVIPPPRFNHPEGRQGQIPGHNWAAQEVGNYVGDYDRRDGLIREQSHARIHRREDQARADQARPKATGSKPPEDKKQNQLFVGSQYDIPRKRFPKFDPDTGI